MSTETLQPPIELSETPVSNFKRRMRELLHKLYEKYSIGKKATDQTTTAEPGIVAGPDTASVFEKLRMMSILMDEFQTKNKDKYSSYAINGQALVKSGSGASNDPFVLDTFLDGKANEFMKDFNNYISELGYKKGVYYQQIRGNAHDRQYYIDEDDKVETFPSTNELTARKLAEAEEKYGLRPPSNQEVSNQDD